MASMSVSGIVSGMDWEGMIDEIITNAAKPAQVKVNKKTNLTNKKSLFEEMKVTMNSLQSSLSPLKLPSTYKAKTIDIERIDKNTSYKGVLTATANADAEVNVWDLTVNQLATAQINRSKQINDSNLTSTLNGVSGKTIYINVGGQKVGVEVKSSDTLESLKSRINTTLKTLESPIYVTASVVDNKLLLKSDYTGLGTMTGRETINYNYSTGINRLSNLSIPEEAYDNVKITSSGKSYTIHKDFEIANGNEIRWKQYDRGNEVALNDTVNVKYTMAAGDKYKNDKGVYGTSEITIENFNVKDFGTLASRAKIVDEDNKTYTYGKDFTINSSGKVVWVDEDDSTTNEPSSYTVSYNKTTTETATANATKSAVGPTSYTVSYSKTSPVASVTATSTGQQYVQNYSFDGTNTSSTFTNFIQGYADAEGLSSTSNLSQTSTGQISGVSYDYVTNMDNISIDGYEYGKDYVLRKGGGNNAGQIVISWNDARNAGHTFVDDYRANVNVPSDTSSVTGSYPSAGDVFTIDYTHTYEYNTDGSGDALSDVLATALSDSGSYSGLVVTDTSTSGNTYSYDNGDFSIIGGQIIWNLTSDDDIDISDIATKFNAVNGTNEIPRVTLTDGNGILRTYLDLAGDSNFTMTDEDGKTYEYGRDYVVRVNDDGDGYVVTWAIASDTNGDGKKDIKDADTVLTTYAQYKKLSTYGMQSAPDTDKSFDFNFTGTSTINASETVKSTDTDKSLATVLNGTSVSSSDYSTALTISDGTKTYAYGTDWTIDSSGNIKWFDATSAIGSGYTATYTFSNSASTSINVSAATIGAGGNSFTRITGISMNNLGLDTVSSNSWNYVTEEYGKAAFALTLDDGTVCEYGKDYTIRASGNNTIDVVYPHNSSWPIPATKDTSASRPSVGFTLTYNNSVTKVSSDSSTSIDNVLGFTPNNLNNLVITDKTGKTYTYNSSSADNLSDTEFTIDNGVVTLKDTAPKQPKAGKTYTFYYDAFSAIDYTGTYAGTTTQEAEIVVDSGYGKIDGNKRSYEQILKDIDIAPTSSTPQSKIDESMSKYFTLTDGTKTYEYGKDYRIIKGSTADSTSGEHSPLIEWISGGTTPAANASFTLSYGGNGGEVLTTDGVTRSATDSITGTPLATDFDGGTVTITQGSKTYYEGVDFNIDEDDDGYANVTWINDNDDNDGGYEWFYPNPGSTYTINHTDEDGNTTTYSATRNSSSTLDVSDYGMTTANGSVSVQYGEGVSYNLNSDATYTVNGTDYDVPSMVRSAYSVDITPTTGSSFNFRWLTPTQTTHSNLPSMNDELTVEYQYDANTFDLSDDGDGDLLKALGFTKSDGSYDDYTKAQGAEIVLNGETIEVDSNDIGADYENEIIKGVTLHLKGTGEVTMDISHDAEKAVESIQSFVDNYNDLMTWMNTRMTEKELDKDTAATVDSDDFRMRWGLLHGNSLLRQTKSQMRSLTSKNFTFTFTQRKSSEEIYGSMAFNGLKTASTLRLRIGSKYVDITIDPSDTLETIVAKLSDDTKNGPMHDFYYDENGQKLQSPLIKASVENDKLEIHSTDNQEITMSGSAAMNALKMNYTYKGLYQIGIESTSDDYGKSGELVFDTDEFMTALEDNPDEVQALMTSFVSEFSAWTSSMLSTSSSGETKGTLTREIDNIQSQIDTINEYLERYQERLDRMEENLRTRYGNTETQFSKLSQQANSIAAILNQLNGTASGGGYGQASS